MSHIRTPILLITLSIALLAIHLIVQNWLNADLIDDAYVFFRYATNLADGNGLVFNPGQYVEGYTSPLWLFCIAVPAMLGLDLAVVAKIVGAALGLGTILLLVFYGRRYLSGERAFLVLLPAWFLVTNTAFEYWVWSGMDTALFTFLFFLTFIVFLRQVTTDGAMGWAGICFLFATLARLEMVVLAPVYLLFIFYINRRQRHLLLRKYGSFLLPQLLLLAHLLWRYTYYGALLPNTFYAKAGVPLSTLVNRGMTYTWDFASAYWLEILLPILAILIFLQARARALSIEWKVALAVVVVWAGCVSVIGGDHFPEFRLYVPILPIMALVMTGSLDYMLGRVAKVRAQTLGRLIQDAGVVAGVMLGIVALNYSAYEFHQEGPRMRANVALTRNWAEVGLWLKRNIPEKSTIATVVIGAIPYYSKLRTLDLLGLTDREIAINGRVAPEAEIGHQKYDTDYVLSQMPDYVIYNSSGQYAEPLYRDPHKITTRYAYALYNFALDERTLKLYEYAAKRMDNGKVIEFLRLRVGDH